MRPSTLDRSRHLKRLGVLAALSLAGCSQYQALDTAALLEQQLRQRLSPEEASAVAPPFALSPEVATAVQTRLSPAGSEKRRTEEILDFIFGALGLRYSLTPTRDAVATYEAGRGNCLSFVNLFVGIARLLRLNPFYVEVQDLQRWNYRDGMVVSQGHIVAGMYVSGELRTFDFLPYRPKSYRDFKPIDDLTATAHYYNNLGAEALMAGDLDRAERLLSLVTRFAPTFVKGLNNYGVLLSRRGQLDEALAVYRRALAVAPDQVAVLTNLARLHQTRGEVDQAAALLDKIEGFQQASPFFYVYRGEQALAEGDLAQALESMRQALKRDSEVPEVHVGLAKVYIAMGELDKARHHIARALQLDATHEEARHYAALLEGRTADGG